LRFLKVVSSPASTRNDCHLFLKLNLRGLALWDRSLAPDMLHCNHIHCVLADKSCGVGSTSAGELSGKIPKVELQKYHRFPASRPL
jgi:hypothetical protein